MCGGFLANLQHRIYGISIMTLNFKAYNTAIHFKNLS